jgi:hypothetical protein
MQWRSFSFKLNWALTLSFLSFGIALSLSMAKKSLFKGIIIA